MEFKDKVKIAREKLVLSQTEFAKELGVAFASVNRWENGVRIPTYMLCNADSMITAHLRAFSFRKTTNNGVSYYEKQKKITSI